MSSIENIAGVVIETSATLNTLELGNAASGLLSAAAALENVSGGSSKTLAEIAERLYEGAERISAAAFALVLSRKEMDGYLVAIGAQPIQASSAGSKSGTEPAPEDRPFDRAVHVAAYSPEMREARDGLAGRMTSLRRTIEARDIANDLPPRLVVDDDLPSRTLIKFGDWPQDPWEALAYHEEEMMLQELDPDHAPADESLIIQYKNDQPGNAEDELFKGDKARQVLAWTLCDGDTTFYDSLHIYDDGYVEYHTHTTRTERFHPEDADEFIRTYTVPSESREVDVVPYTIRSATEADIAAHQTRLQNMCARYGIVLP